MLPKERRKKQNKSAKNLKKEERKSPPTPQEGFEKNKDSLA